MYSWTWQAVNRTPRRADFSVNLAACARLACTSCMCARVIVSPDKRRRDVFRRGTANGFRGSIPIGGHVQPVSGVGARALWKKAQKKARKNIASEAMKRIIPTRSPRAT